MSPEVILVTVDIQANNQRLVELTKQLNENRTALKALSDANKDGRLSNDDLAAGQVRLSQSSKQAQGEIAQLNKVNAQQTKANQAGAGSIEQLRAQLALGTKAYNGMSQSERESTEAGQKLQATNRGLSDQLKVLEKAVGDTRRNVGNYNEGIKDVNVVSGKLTEGLRTAADKGLSPFKAQLEQGTGILGKFKSGSDLVKQGMGLLKGAGEAGSLGFKAIASGIALTGIGLFVLAISAVVTYFTQSAEGGKILAGIMGGLGAVLQVATDAVTSMGKAIVYAVTHPLEAIANLSTALTNAFLHPIDTARGLGNAVGDLGTKISSAAKAGNALVLEQKALIVARRELEIEDVKEQSRVNVLLRLSKERGKSADEQLASLKEAGRLEAELTEKNIKLQQREAAAIRENIRQKGEGKAADLKAELGAKEKEIAQTLASQDETNAKIQVRESVFQQKMRADATAAIKAAREARIIASADEVRDRQARLETALLSVVKGSAAELVIKKKQVEAARDMELIGDKVTGDQKKLIRAKSLVDIKQLQDDFNQKAIEAAKKAAEQDAKTIAARVTEANREYALAEKALEDYLNTKRAAVERDRAAGKLSEFEYKKQLNAIEKAGNDAALVNAKDYAKDSGAIEKKAADTELARINLLKDEKKRIAEAEITIQQASLEAATITSDLIIDGFGKESAAGQVALAAKKIFALAEVAINLERQLSANALYGSTLGPLGLPYQIATDALAIAGALASAAKIAGFAQGGYVSGAGTGTSDSIPARLSNGESVMNANTTAMYGGLLSHLNVLGGGVAFATGGLVPSSPTRAVPVADGGLVARQLGGMAGVIDYTALAQAMSAVNLEVGVKAITKATTRYNTPRALSTLG